MKIFSSKWRWTSAAAILLLLFLFRPGASRLKSRIIVSMSSAIGRSVDIGSVRLRLLPRPGFDIENLTVYDAPEFGAEPMLRASAVTAVLRLVSLVRGRIEIARLEITEPSFNLVHGDSGRWNLEALLEHTSQHTLAPTGKRKSEPRPAFPYIEATSARINFKNGPEKRAFALTNADFSLWQESENSWGIRLTAQPVRSDLNLNDTGILRVNGTWQRAAAIRDTPMDFTLEWNGAQLGQLTKMLTSADQGWRGGTQLELRFTGTPTKLAISSSISIQDFRRYDITNGEQLRLAAHCDGEYSSLDHGFHEIMCNAPVGTGLITLKGDTGFPGSRRYGLVLLAKNIPASALAAVAQHVKKNLPEDLIAQGVLRGSIAIDESSASDLQLEGQGEIAGFHLSSAANRAEIAPETIPFAFTSSESATLGGRASRKGAFAIQLASGPRFELGPFAVGSGRTIPATIRGWVSRSGYDFALTGEADIAKTLGLARLTGLPAVNATANGLVQLDLRIAGSWSAWNDSTHAEFLGPQITGKAKLRNVQVSVRGVGGAIEITTADLQLAPDKVRVEKLNLSAADSSWTGSLEMPRGCGTPGACEVHFNLNADRIALAALSEWARPHSKEQPWYRAMASTAPQGPSFLASLRASGRLTTENFRIHSLTASHVSASIVVDREKLRISELAAEMFGGQHRGTWQADFSAKPTICSGNGNVTGLTLAHLGDVAKFQGVIGTGNTSYRLSGPCSAQFWPTGEGTVQFDLAQGVMPHFSLTESEGPLEFARLSGQVQLHDGAFEMKDVKLDSSGAKFQISGTALLTQKLDLKLERSALGNVSGYVITGTLSEPRVESVTRTEQARLKPDPPK